MYKEANNFHRIVLPILITICLLFLLMGCSRAKFNETKKPLEPEVITIIEKEYTIIDLLDICNSTIGDDIVQLSNITKLVIKNNKCRIQIDLGEE